MPIITLPDGSQIKTVDRDQLLFKAHGRTFAYPGHLKNARRRAPAFVKVFDFSKAEKIVYPIQGNNQYGDCYYVACQNGSRTFTGNSGVECEFGLAPTIARYLKLSGGDNGLNDQLMMPEWKSGITGPNGPRRILDEMTVDVGDVESCIDAASSCGGLIWTCSLIPKWIDIAKPGAIWDASAGNPNPAYGHAMFLTGRHQNGNWDVRTWGITPPVQVTQAGINKVDSELICVFSLDHFNKNGICAFTGMTYDQKAVWWAQRGGQTLPPSPFGPPTPPLPPAPIPIPPTPNPPVPPMPAPTPMPPIPGYLKPIGDWLFTMIEASLTGWQLMAVQMLHKLFDGLFVTNPALFAKTIGSISELQQFLDAELQLAIDAVPFAYFKGILQDAKDSLDAWFAIWNGTGSPPVAFNFKFSKAA